MASTPTFVGAVSTEVASLTAPVAVTARTNIAGVTGLTQLTAVSAIGKRTDFITVKGKAATVASNLFLWLFDGTTSYLLSEIDLPAVTPTNTVDSVEITKYFPTGLNLMAGQRLYVSVTVSVDVNVFASGATY